LEVPVIREDRRDRPGARPFRVDGTGLIEIQPEAGEILQPQVPIPVDLGVLQPASVARMTGEGEKIDG
jgi:hypothetical protein